MTFTQRSVLVVNHFAGDPIESLVDPQGHVLVLATGLTGADASGIISASQADDFMDGRGGDDYLFGNDGKDILLGGAGDDHLDGGKGNDILDGGSGNDSLTWGKGHDSFVFAPIGTDGMPGGNDVISDFVHGEDRVDLTAFHTDLSALFGTHEAHPLHHGDAITNSGPITIAADGHDTVLSFVGGSIRVVGVDHLQASDFILS
jgi:Ca2+-binding RTX toxin-like protein